MTEEELEEGDQDGREVVEQMMSNYEDYREQTDQTASPSSVVPDLPDKFVYEDGKLFTTDKYSKNSKGGDSRISLTEIRKEALMAKVENPDATLQEVAESVGCSGSVVSRAITHFGELLEEPKLFEAFVLEGRAPSDSWKVVHEDGTTVTAPSKKIAKRKLREMFVEGDEGAIRGPNGEEFTVYDLGSKLLEGRQSSGQSSGEQESEEGGSDVSQISDYENLAEDEEVLSDDEFAEEVSDEAEELLEEMESESVSFSVDQTQFNSILGALYRDGQDGVAADLLDQY